MRKEFRTKLKGDESLARVCFEHKNATERSIVSERSSNHELAFRMQSADVCHVFFLECRQPLCSVAER
jgi:hypothetical protein